jgi:hypothetical protein
MKSGSPAMPEQAAWGTATADTADALELAVQTIEVNEDVKNREGNSNYSGSRDDDIANHQNDTKGSMPTFELTTPGGVRKGEIANFLYAFMQNVSEGAATPYAKTYTFPATQPDFTANAGYFATFGFQDPTATYGLEIKDCIGADKIAFNLAVDKYLEISQTWRGRGAPAVDFAPSTGTWARAAISRYHYLDCAMTVDYGSGDTAVTMIGDQSWEMTQEVVPVGNDSGNVQTYGIRNHKGTFNLTILYDATARAIEADYRTGTINKIKLRWGNATPGTVDGDLYFYFGIIVKSAKRIEGNGGVYALNITGAIVGDAANGLEQMTIICADAIDHAW